MTLVDALSGVDEPTERTPDGEGFLLKLRVLFEELPLRFGDVRVAVPVESARSNQHTGIR